MAPKSTKSANTLILILHFSLERWVRKCISNASHVICGKFKLFPSNSASPLEELHSPLSLLTGHSNFRNTDLLPRNLAVHLLYIHSPRLISFSICHSLTLEIWPLFNLQFPHCIWTTRDEFFFLDRNFHFNIRLWILTVVCKFRNAELTCAIPSWFIISCGHAAAQSTRLRMNEVFWSVLIRFLSQMMKQHGETGTELSAGSQHNGCPDLHNSWDLY